MAREQESGARLEYIVCGALWGLYRDKPLIPSIRRVITLMKRSYMSNGNKLVRSTPMLHHPDSFN